METINIEYQGKKYPCVEIDLADVYDGCNHAETLACDECLWDELEEGVINGDEEAVETDNMVAFYLPIGFIDTNPTYDEVIAEIKKIIA